MTIAAVNDWCIEGTFTPSTGAWRPVSPTSFRLFTLGPANNVGPPYAVRCDVVQDTFGGCGLICQIADPSGAWSRVYLSFASALVTEPIAGSAHKIAMSYESGMLRLYFDDVQIDMQTDYLGRVTARSLPSPTGGTADAGFTNAGLTVAAQPFPNSGTKTRYNILWLGDSVHLNPNELQDFSGRLTLAGYQATYSLAAYGSNTMGNGFLELSDDVFAYEDGQWKTKTRWKPLTSYDAVAFDYMDNETNTDPPIGMTTVEYRRGYDKIVAQATKYIPRTVMASPPPQCADDFSAWTPAAKETASHGVLGAIATKWNVPFVDYFVSFPAAVVATTYTIAQLMRDVIHPTNSKGDAGIKVMGDAVWTYLLAAPAPIAATPEITGTVVSYLWGQPTAGQWGMQSLEQVTNTWPGETALFRVARSPDQALVASATGAKLSFPERSFSLLFVHTIGTGSSGTFNVVVDRGLAGEFTKAFTLTASGNYPKSFFVKDWGTASLHTVEVETTGAAAVNIVGVSYIGVP